AARHRHPDHQCHAELPDRAAVVRRPAGGRLFADLLRPADAARARRLFEVRMKRPFLLRLFEDYWGVLLILIAWEFWVIVNSFNPIVRPPPVAVVRDLVTNTSVYLGSVGITLGVAVFGLVVGMAVGTALAVGAWFSPIASGILNPLTVLFSSVPVVA